MKSSGRGESAEGACAQLGKEKGRRKGEKEREGRNNKGTALLSEQEGEREARREEGKLTVEDKGQVGCTVCIVRVW